MNGQPLIAYAIQTALECSLVTDVVLTSDDDEILTCGEAYGALPLKRRSELALDTVTLDPVVYDALLYMEHRTNNHYDAVVTLQPTSPTLKASTLEEALRSFLTGEFDTIISVVNKPHLAWAEQDGRYFALYETRLNRQQLPPHYMETGAFLISGRTCITAESRIGRRMRAWVISNEEAIDIDDASDWQICENLLSRKRIVLRAHGHRNIGMGHIYHALTLYYNLTGHEVMFVTSSAFSEGVSKLQSCFVPLTLLDTDQEFFSFLEAYKPDIVVNDCLDTTAEYIQEVKSRCPRVVTIEDQGEGAELADVVINALYDEDIPCTINAYYGQKYACLRDEFVIATPSPFRQEVENVLILFGGTDPSDLTSLLYQTVSEIGEQYPSITFTFLTGFGYDAVAHGVTTQKDKHIYVVNDAKHVSDYMHDADLAVTSQGRTLYELATMGVPAIVMAQNKREQLHHFANMQNGFLNIGLGQEVQSDTLKRTLDWLIRTPQIRSEMRTLMLSHNLKGGIKRVLKLILGE